MKRFSRPRATAELSKSLNHDLNMYTLAAGAAGVGLLALAQPAQAKIVYTPTHAEGLKVPLDLNHDGITDFYLHHGTSNASRRLTACQYWFSGSNSGCISHGSNAIVRGRTTESFFFGAALRHGEKINRGDPFVKGSLLLGRVLYSTSSNNETFWSGPWMSGGRGVKNRYLGLKFKIKGRFHFGWARLTVTTTHNNFKAILTGYAYETIPGKGIIAGKTKGPDVITVQPASLGHLAAGASALPAWRVKRTTATTH